MKHRHSLSNTAKAKRVRRKKGGLRAIMSDDALPDDLWRKIMKIGVQSSNLSYSDVCRVSISCRRFHRLSNEDRLWSILLSSDFPRANHRSNYAKRRYKHRLEKDRAQKLAALGRSVDKLERRIARISRRSNRNKAAVARLLNVLEVSGCSRCTELDVERCDVHERLNVIEDGIKRVDQDLENYKQTLATIKELLDSLTTRKVDERLVSSKRLKRSITDDKEECEASGADKKSLKL